MHIVGQPVVQTKKKFKSPAQQAQQIRQRTKQVQQVQQQDKRLRNSSQNPRQSPEPPANQALDSGYEADDNESMPLKITSTFSKNGVTQNKSNSDNASDIIIVTEQENPMLGTSRSDFETEPMNFGENDSLLEGSIIVTKEELIEDSMPGPSRSDFGAEHPNVAANASSDNASTMTKKLTLAEVKIDQGKTYTVKIRHYPHDSIYLAQLKKKMPVVDPDNFRYYLKRHEGVFEEFDDDDPDPLPVFDNRISVECMKNNNI